MRVHFKVYGKAKGKERPRFNSKRGITYTPKNTINYESEIKGAYIEVSKGRNLFGDKSVLMVVVEHKSIPKNITKAKLNLIMRDELFPTTKPDYDNVAKVVSDALNGIAFKDDSQVVAFSDKVYTKSDMPYIEVFLIERTRHYKKDLINILDYY